MSCIGTSILCALLLSPMLPLSAPAQLAQGAVNGQVALSSARDEQPAVLRYFDTVAAESLIMPSNENVRLAMLAPRRMSIVWPPNRSIDIEPSHGSRSKHVLIGVAIGAAVGLGVVLLDQSRCTSTNGIPCALGIGNDLFVFAGGGALAGCLVGAIWPASR